jgi:hypothetical protein
MIPELELGIIVLTNSESNVTSAIANQITDSYLGLKGIDRAAEMHTRLTNSEEAASKLKIQLSYKVNLNQGNHLVNPQRFTGIYHDQWFGNVVISILKNQLWFRSQRSPQLKGVLLPYGDNTFYIKWQNPEIDSDALVCFTFKTNGTVQDFILKPAIPGMVLRKCLVTRIDYAFNVLVIYS